jgi:hypothetical protein
VTEETHLVIGKLQTKLLNTRLDGIPSGKSMSNRDIASKTEVFWLEDLVGTGVVEDGLGMDSSLVREGTVAPVYAKVSHECM